VTNATQNLIPKRNPLRGFSRHNKKWTIEIWGIVIYLLFDAWYLPFLREGVRPVVLEKKRLIDYATCGG
jgi:hypothetical protein